VLIPHEIFLDRKKTVTEVQASSQVDLSPTLLPITATLQRVTGVGQRLCRTG